MRLCINAYAYMHQRRRVSGRQVRGGTDFPASKIAKTKNVPREANKLWGEKFSWIREREIERGGGEERREDGIKRNMEYEDGATPTSSPCLFRTPFRWSVYIGESVWSRILAGLNYLFVPRFSFSPSFFSSYPSYPCIINDLVGKKNWSKIFLNQRREKINK